MTKSDKTRHYIVEKTASIFNKKGYSGTSLSDMITATGLTKGSIYGNFINKDDVALAAFDYNIKTVEMKIEALMAKQPATKDKLLGYSLVYQELIKGEFCPGGCPILNTSIDADDTHPALRERALIALLAWKNRIVKLIRAGMANSEIAAEANPEQIALTMIAIIEGGIMISRLTDKLETREMLRESLTAYINNLS